MIEQPCQTCGGKRLKAESLAVLVHGRSIGDVVDLPVERAIEFFESIPLRGAQRAAQRAWMRRSPARSSRKSPTGFASCATSGSTTSRSAAARPRSPAARPSASGWPPRSAPAWWACSTSWTSRASGCTSGTTSACSRTLRGLRDLGNTVIVVEHDADTIEAADHVIDLGPRAGRFGGEVIAEGTVDDDPTPSRPRSPGAISGASSACRCPGGRREAEPKHRLRVVGARANNLRNLTVDIPLGVFTAVTGVSGSGKSTLVTDILYQALARHFYRAKVVPGAHTRIEGLDRIDKVIDIDQSPIGRTPAVQSRDLHRAVHADPRAVHPAARREDARLRSGPLLVQREGRPLRGVPGRRPGEDRDALPARRLRAVRGVQGPAVQPRDAGGALQGPEHRRRARPHRGRRAGLLQQPAAHRREARAAERRRAWATSTSARRPRP